MDNIFQWEESSRLSQPTGVYESQYHESKKVRDHDYAMLTKEGLILNGTQMFDGNNFLSNKDIFDIRKHIPEINFMNIVFEKVCSTLRNMRRGTQVVSIEHQNDILNLLLTGDSLIISKHKWKNFYKSKVISSEKAWDDMLRRFFVEWFIKDFGRMNDWLGDRINNQWEKGSDDCMHMHDYLGGRLYDMNANERAEHLDDAVRMWYELFPNFPKNVTEAKKMRDDMDRTVITIAYKRFISEYATKSKELRNVLTNTLPNLEQSELFPEGIPVN